MFLSASLLCGGGRVLVPCVCALTLGVGVDSHAHLPQMQVHVAHPATVGGAEALGGAPAVTATGQPGVPPDQQGTPTLMHQQSQDVKPKSSKFCSSPKPYPKHSFSTCMLTRLYFYQGFFNIWAFSILDIFYFHFHFRWYISDDVR